MDRQELAEELRAMVQKCKNTDPVLVVHIRDLADRLSTAEKWPKWLVSPRFPKETLPWYGKNMAYIRLDDLWSGVVVSIDGTEDVSEEYTWFLSRGWGEVTEAEAKAHVRPKPPKGYRLTGEFRVPIVGHDLWLRNCSVCGADTAYDRLGTSFNGGKRWILEDDRCLACGRAT